MSEYLVSEIKADDKRFRRQQEALLIREGISLDNNLDYSLGLFDEDYNLAATGSCFKNTLRCMAVDKNHQGEGLLNRLVTELINYEHERGYFDLFLYTKIDSAKFFADLGFHTIAEVSGKLIFMENDANAFKSYLRELNQNAPAGKNIGAVVMNANPFTLGHRYLIETASAGCDYVHVFVVSEDASVVPADVRYELVRKGCRHLSNVILHKSGSYIISSATFPSYFLKDKELVIRTHAALDIQIFSQIAKAAHITKRFVGEEPVSEVTGIYNEIMCEKLPENGIKVEVIPRRKASGEIISASNVRELIRKGRISALKGLVPDTTYEYFCSPEAEPVIAAIKKAGNVIHY